MKTEEAISIIEQVCAKFVGNLADHEQIQIALRVIKMQLAEANKNSDNVQEQALEVLSKDN